MYSDTSNSENNHLITHSDRSANVDKIVSELKKRIIAEGDKSDATVSEQLALVDELSVFGFGRFLLENRGINGFWTQYLVLWPIRNKNGLSHSSLSPLERWILEEAPAVQATQERFTHFQTLLQKSLKDGITMVSLPCGMMDDLLNLDFSSTPNIKLIGIDLDKSSIDSAKAAADKLNLSSRTSFMQTDAWKLNLNNEVDVLTSNGLNIYEPDDNKVVELYKKFYTALKPGGILITSFLTPPPTIDPNSPWNIKAINPENLRRQKIIFTYIISAKWQSFRTELQTIKQLQKAGFKEIEIIYDSNKMFPTVFAKK